MKLSAKWRFCTLNTDKLWAEHGQIMGLNTDRLWANTDRLWVNAPANNDKFSGVRYMKKAGGLTPFPQRDKYKPVNG